MVQEGAGGKARQLNAYCSCRGSGLGFQHPCEEAHNCYSSRDSDILFWILQAPAFRRTYAHPDMHTHINKN